MKADVLTRECLVGKTESSLRWLKPKEINHKIPIWIGTLPVSVNCSQGGRVILHKYGYQGPYVYINGYCIEQKKS